MEFPGDRIIKGAKNALRSHDSPEIPDQVKRASSREITFPRARTEFPEPRGINGFDLANAITQGVISPGDAIRVKPAEPKSTDKWVKFFYVEPGKPIIEPRSKQPRMTHILYSLLPGQTFVSVGDIGEWEKLDETTVPTFVRKAIERRNMRKDKSEQISRLRGLLNKLQGK